MIKQAVQACFFYDKMVTDRIIISNKFGDYFTNLVENAPLIYQMQNYHYSLLE